jgi:hypothetical protein
MFAAATADAAAARGQFSEHYLDLIVSRAMADCHQGSW